jgi:hypothetical protein
MDRRKMRKWVVVKGTTSNGRNSDKFTAVKVHRECPLVLLVKGKKVLSSLQRSAF